MNTLPPSLESHLFLKAKELLLLITTNLQQQQRPPPNSNPPSNHPNPLPPKNPQNNKNKKKKPSSTLPRPSSISSPVFSQTFWLTQNPNNSKVFILVHGYISCQHYQSFIKSQLTNKSQHYSRRRRKPPIPIPKNAKSNTSDSFGRFWFVGRPLEGY